jgi:hypothetical protein
MNFTVHGMEVGSWINLDEGKTLTGNQEITSVFSKFHGFLLPSSNSE